MTPYEVITQVHGLFLKRDVEGMADLLAEDVVVEHPFPSPRIPERIDGREAVRAHMTKAVATSPAEFHRFDIETVHETTDPEVIIIEHALTGRITASGEPFRRRYIQVIRVRADKIVFWRDYTSA
jgi:ketosteroid isomerase-like protein